jgi:clan AA aspartic protease
MGITYIKGTVSGRTDASVLVEFLVDSGAKYSVLPKRIWRRLGLTPQRTVTFCLADGTMIERSLSECHLELPQGECTMPVVLGQAKDMALLGVITLEILGLVLNPFTRELLPMRLVMAAIA